MITDAISRQEWTGDATVNVSIVDWVKSPVPEPKRFVLDGVEVDGISPALRSTDNDVSSAVGLAANKGVAFQGPIPVGDGFLLDDAEATALLERPEAKYKEVVRPYLIGRDIAEDPRQRPRRWIIDFASKPLEDARRWPAALQLVRERVKPARDRNKDKGFREKWWLFGRPRGEMRNAIEGHDRYIGGTATWKRLYFCWVDTTTCPSNATNVFAFDNDYSMGVLCSSSHNAWAWENSSTIRVDLRYTPTTVFETFPWPSPSIDQRDAISAACHELLNLRGELCVERNIGLTALYNEVDEGMHEG